MHRSSALTGSNINAEKVKVDWAGPTPEEWFNRQPCREWKAFFKENGYLVVNELLEPEEVKVYQDVYDKMLSGEIETSAYRHDLGSHKEARDGKENICQIMWPSLHIADLQEGPLHKRAALVSQVILGEDATFDFDMLIYKAPHTDTETPWHQDESYWPDLSDKRAVSCWVALDTATVENGCMWFVPKSHNEGLRPHQPAAKGHHVLMCGTDEGSQRGIPIPLSPGSCTFHHGRTLHHTEGNKTSTRRRAYIVNFRPEQMVKEERQQGFDHGQQGVQGVLGEGKTHKLQE